MTWRSIGGAAFFLAMGTLIPAQAQQTAQPQPRQRGNQANQEQAGQAMPEGWTRVSIDENGDGRIDRTVMIHQYDLRQAAQSSAMRRRGLLPTGRMPARSTGRTAYDRVEGTLQDLKTTRLAGMGEEQHTLGRIKTEQGRTARVHLGPTSQVQRLDLQEGDTVTVFGARGLINDRPMLMARRIESGGQFINVTLPEDRALRRFRGEVTSTRTTQIQNRDEPFVVAKLRLRNGREYPAILGSQSKLSDLGLAQGDSIMLLARPGRFNNQPALIAEQIHAKDRTVVVEQPDRRRIEAQPQ